MNVFIDKTVLEKTIISPSYAHVPARAAFSEHLKKNKQNKPLFGNKNIPEYFFRVSLIIKATPIYYDV